MNKRAAFPASVWILEMQLFFDAYDHAESPFFLFLPKPADLPVKWPELFPGPFPKKDGTGKEETFVTKRFGASMDRSQESVRQNPISRMPCQISDTDYRSGVALSTLYTRPWNR